MPEINDYRLLSQTSMRRVFMSLGLPKEDFSTVQPDADSRPFQTLLNAGSVQPNGLWMFKGSDFYLYDLDSDEVISGPTPIKDAFGAGALPSQFDVVESAAWLGPVFPKLWTFFTDETYYTMNSENGWSQSEGPRGVLGAWSTGVWCNPDGTYKTPGAPVALHGVGSKYAATVHFFKDGEYVRHNLMTGGAVAGPMPIGQEWKLPAPFLSRIDYAFYGSGSNASNINFIAGDDYVLYDFRAQKVLDYRPVEKRFPVFGQFVNRPQVFLAEDYTLETLVGPVSLGRLIDTRSIGAGSKITKVLVTETTDTSKQAITSSMLSSQDSTVSKDFYDKLDDNASSDKSSDSYKYQLDAQFHGDASANSLWGGEVNAKLAVQGGTDDLRANLSQATFKSISSQVEEAKRDTQQKAYNDLSEKEENVHVLKSDTFSEENTTDHVRVYEFFEQLQSYVTLLVLRQVVIAYSDGVSRPRVVQLPAARDLLSDVLNSPAEVQQVLDYLRQELSHVVGQDGQVHSLLTDNAAGDLNLVNNLTTNYVITKPEGGQQIVPVSGVLKSDRSWVEPTFTITCVQKSATD
jgi:hypothetical protein